MNGTEMVTMTKIPRRLREVKSNPQTINCGDSFIALSSITSIVKQPARPASEGFRDYRGHQHGRYTALPERVIVKAAGEQYIYCP
jgi:hypothetical protein